MRKLILAAASVAALAVIGPASAQAPIVIKFSHVVAPNTPKGKAAEKFKELAEKYTNGKVKVEVYPNSQLYKDKEELEALQLGAVQMLAPSLAKFGPIGVQGVRGVRSSLHPARQGGAAQSHRRPARHQAAQAARAQGHDGLAYWDNGFKEMSANKPLRMPADFQGLKMRIQSSKVLEAQFRALGAIPQVMAFSEVYQALQTGVVDGHGEHAVEHLHPENARGAEVHRPLTNHGYIGYVVIVNKKFWDGLPADIRAAARKGDGGSDRLCQRIAQKENDEAHGGDQESPARPRSSS